MKTIVISDKAFLGETLEEVAEGIYYLKHLQKYDTKVVLLSSLPEYWMKNVTINWQKKKVYQKENPTLEKKRGMTFELVNDSGVRKKICLYGDYTIIGNGSQILDDQEVVMYEKSGIQRKKLEEYVQFLKDSGYVSMDEKKQVWPNLKKVYRFLTPMRVCDVPTDNVYGILCQKCDDEQLQKVSQKFPEIKSLGNTDDGYFFFNKINKLMAVNYLVNMGCLKEEDMQFILADETEEELMMAYPFQTYCLGNSLHPKTSLQTEKSLIKVLNRIDR